MQKIFKKTFKIFVDILVFIAFAILLIIILAKVNMIIKNQTYFEVFGYSVFNIATGSMEPEISQNDIIIVKKQDTYKINDIVTYKKVNDYITHRIIKIDGSTIITKGDANNASDVSITEDVIVGTVIFKLKNAGVWQKILTKPSIIIMIFITLILFDFAFSYKGHKNKKLVNEIDNRNIDIAKVIKSNEEFNFNKEEIKVLKEKIETKDTDLNNKEQKLLEYTIRLDLTNLQKEIKNKMNKEE